MKKLQNISEIGKLYQFHSLAVLFDVVSTSVSSWLRAMALKETPRMRPCTSHLRYVHSIPDGLAMAGLGQEAQPRRVHGLVRAVQRVFLQRVV